MKLHDVIRTRRQTLGLTQEELARRLGVSAPAVNKWERSIHYPDITLLPVLRVAMAAAVAWSAVYRFFTLFATQPWLQGLNPSLYFNVARLVQFWM
ncbi:MAG: XRE family transcriptional regulator [Clostridiales bacterium]|nr:XRE family transcriptional regulator [Clostridiales bacterium]